MPDSQAPSPSHVSHYRILEKLGSGGMGIVYKAEDTQLHRFVALKFLPAELANDSIAVERLRREARAASALSHAHICTIYEIGEHEGQPFIAMEFLEGLTLKERIRAKPIRLDDILEIAVEIADALDAAHARGVIHRDIKPANIFLTYFRSGPAGASPETRRAGVKILDFGLAKLTPTVARAGQTQTAASFLTASVDGPISTTGALVGTISYMSPEQVRGQELDARSDLFSFGAVLYEMVALRTPFPAESTGLIIDAILNREPVPLAHLSPNAPPKLQEIVQKALEKDRDLRYQSAAEMRADLKRLKRDSESGRHSGSASRAVAAVTRAQAPASKRLYYGITAAVVVVLGVLLAFGLLFLRRPPSLKPAPSNQWEQLTFFTDSAVYPAISPDGRMLAFIRGDDSFLTPGQLYIQMLPNGQPVQLTHDARSKLSPVFSPDGSRIAYGVALPWETWEVAVLGGEPRQILPNSSSLTWIDDGRNILFSELRLGVHMVVVTANEARGNARDVYAPAGARSMAHHSYLSPDGRRVLIVEMDNRGDLISCRVVPFTGASGPPQIVGPPDGSCTNGAWSKDGQYVYVSVVVKGASHIWRQRFPAGQPEQVTSGPTTEEGIAMAPDGQSFITSVGATDTTVWIHDSSGEHQMSSEGQSDAASFSNDGKLLYYMGISGRSTDWELYVRDLVTGKSERMVPGYAVDSYSVSHDGKLVAFSQIDANNHSAIWVGPTSRLLSPVQIASSASDDHPSFLPDGDILFRSIENGTGYIYRMKPDGSNRRKVVPSSIFDLHSVSPDGRWAIASEPSIEAVSIGAFAFAFPVAGGEPVILCRTYCEPLWDAGGHSLFVFMPDLNGQEDSQRTFVLPLDSASGLPRLPKGGLRSIEDLKAARAIAVPRHVSSALSTSNYAYVQRTTRRNLYRIPID